MSYEHTEKPMIASLPHSPAPFSLQPCTADHGKTSVICDPTNYVLARIDSAAWNDEPAADDEAIQDRVNALLFVAAPELLAALKNLLRQKSEHPGCVESASHLWDDVHAAIAKAEGRA